MKNLIIFGIGTTAMVVVCVWAIVRYRKKEQRKCPKCGHWRERRHKMELIRGRNYRTRTSDYCEKCEEDTLVRFVEDRNLSRTSYAWRKVFHKEQFLVDGFLCVFGACINDIGVVVGGSANHGFRIVMKIFQDRIDRKSNQAEESNRNIRLKQDDKM